MFSSHVSSRALVVACLALGTLLACSSSESGDDPGSTSGGSSSGGSSSGAGTSSSGGSSSGGATSSSSSSSSSSGTPPSPTAITAYCDANKKRSGTCGSDEEYQACLSKEGPCQAKRLRPEALDALTKCLGAAAPCTGTESTCQCEGSEDACFASTVKALPRTPKVEAYATACHAKLAECGKGKDGFSDDYCALDAMLTDAMLDTLSPCFQQACGGVAACLRTGMAGADGACAKN